VLERGRPAPATPRPEPVRPGSLGHWTEEALG